MSTAETFLVVDDEPDMCWAFEQVLKSGGFGACKAQNGREALALLGQYPFRGIFLDAKLPDMEGLELARRIRSLDPHIPMIMVSGFFYRDDVLIQEALADGLISHFIAKPFQRSEILQAVEAFRGGH
jgi:CheY-like chemotaxis protein